METYQIDGLKISITRTFKEDGKSIVEALVDIFIEYTKEKNIEIIDD